MTKLLITITAFLCLVDVVEAQQPPLAKDVPQKNYEVVVYPEEIYFGDPVYIHIRFKNNSEEVKLHRIYFKPDLGPLWLSLQSESISVPYHLLREYKFSSSYESRLSFPFYNLQPGESMLIFDAYRELPALEDMDSPFWEEAKKRLNSGETITAYIGLERRSRDGKQPPEPNYDTVSTPLRIKPRPNSEMERLERWLEGTPERLRPVPFDQMLAEGKYFDYPILKDEFDALPLTPKPGFVSRERYLKINRNDRIYFASNEHFIKVQGKDYFPYLFLRYANRKPGDPVCPETWQGWKELENSLTPSTMRDEIRLTRMLIQYCDTKDEKVLVELKKWFAIMNDWQRKSMASSLSQRMDQVVRYENLASSFQKFYQAIQEYDTIPKLQDVGTLNLNAIIN